MKCQHVTALLWTVSTFYFPKGLERKFNRIIPIFFCQDYRHLGILEFYFMLGIEVFSNRLKDRRRCCISTAISAMIYGEGMKIGVVGSPDNSIFFLIPFMQPLITSKD
jgi:hypothetical protein